MLVRKEIDINEMIDILENAVSESEEKGMYIVRIDVSSVLMLLDVLRETKQREEKPKCFGKYDKDDNACLLCECMIECKEGNK